jgi:hypothetical protein
MNNHKEKLIKRGIKIFLTLLFVIIIYSLLFIHLKRNGVQLNNGQISGASSQSYSTSVDVSIGEYRFNLFGYSSPDALITFSGMGIADQTYADSGGYFEFKNRFSPFSPREACLTTQDQLGRLTTPVCLPPFPTKYDVSIGPVIMPPTLSLDKNDYWVGDEVVVAGQTIPNTDVNLSLFTKDSRRLITNLHGVKKMVGGASEKVPREADFRSDRKSLAAEEVHERQNLPFFFRLIKPVEAFSFPALQTKSDDRGNFSLALPSTSAKSYRLFTQASFQNETSARSTTLTLTILPLWMIVIKIFLLIWQIIKSRLIELFVVAELLVLAIYCLRRYCHPQTVAKTRALALPPNLLPMIKEEKRAI